MMYIFINLMKISYLYGSIQFVEIYLYKFYDKFITIKDLE